MRPARWLASPLLAFALTRLGILLVIYVSAPLFPDSTSPPPYHVRAQNVLIDTLGSRWDTGFYLEVAQKGYHFRGVPLPSVAFFPLLPLLIRATTPLVGDPLVAGIVLCNFALAGACLFIYRLALEEFGAEVAERAVWYLVIFPSSFFGSAIYTESWLLLTGAGALYCARHQRWGLSAGLGFAAALSRFAGVFVAPLLFLEALRQRAAGVPERRSLWIAFLASAAVPLGTLSYMAYLQGQFSEPLAFFKAQAAWGRLAQTPLNVLTNLVRAPVEGWGPAILAGHVAVNDWIDFLALALFTGTGVVLLSRRRWSEAVYVLLGALIPFSTGSLMSLRRHVWTLFPVFVVWARWGARPWFDRFVTTVSLLGLAVLTALFANWYWAG